MIFKIFLPIFLFLIIINEAKLNTCPICIDNYVLTKTNRCCHNRFCVIPLAIYVTPVENGYTCLCDNNCQSGYCNPSFKTCQQAPDGHACSNRGQCASGWCGKVLAKCITPICTASNGNKLSMNNSFTLSANILNKYTEIGKPRKTPSAYSCCQSCGTACYAYTYSQGTKVCHNYGLKNGVNPQNNLNAISVQQNYEIDFSSTSGYPI